MSSSPALVGSLGGRTVTVVGAGVIGLTTALRMRAEGADVGVVSWPDFPQASIAACACWLPSWVEGRTADILGDPGEQSVIEQSWNACHALREAYGVAAGMRTLRNLEYLEDGAVDPPAWLQHLLDPSVITAVEMECGGLRYSRCWAFDSVVIDMKIHMPWLVARALADGVTFREQRLTSLDDVIRGRGTDLVVNCTGLGSRRLVDDSAVSPVRGHLIHFEADPDVHASLRAVAINEYYLIPRIHDVVVGGLLREEADPDNTIPEFDQDDEDLVLSMVERLSELAGAESPAQLRRTPAPSMIGLRPRRRGGYRLEVNRSGEIPVIHNYGHGGNGVTLAWGCADRVVEMALDEFASV